MLNERLVRVRGACDVDAPCDQKRRLGINPGVHFGGCDHFVKPSQALIQPNQPLRERRVEGGDEAVVLAGR